MSKIIDLLKAKKCYSHEIGDFYISHDVDDHICRIERLETMLEESSKLFKEYARSHRVRGYEHHEKAQRNEDMAKRIDRLLITGAE